MSEKYCTQCNYPVEQNVQVDEIKTSICRECSRIEYGYSKEWEPFVRDLQGILPNDLWQIWYIVGAAKRHLQVEETSKVEREVKKAKIFKGELLELLQQITNSRVGTCGDYRVYSSTQFTKKRIDELMERLVESL